MASIGLIVIILVLLFAVLFLITVCYLFRDKIYMYQIIMSYISTNYIPVALVVSRRDAINLPRVKTVEICRDPIAIATIIEVV